VEPTPPLDVLASLRPRLRERLSRGDQRGALEVLAQGINLKSDDQNFTAQLNGMLRSAETRARNELAEAARADGARLGQPEFGQGQRRLDDAANGVSAGNRIGATRAFWSAAELLEASRLKAKAASETLQRAQAAQPPAAVTQAPPPSQVPPAPSAPPVAQTPAPAPPAAAPPQPVPADEHAGDRLAIDQLLNQYEAAWRALDAAAVRRLDARAPRNLDATFDTYRSLNAVLANRQFNFQGSTATVSCVRIVDGVSKRGNTRQPTLSTPMTFRFQRFGGSWALAETR
jgi:hypothetical protein